MNTDVKILNKISSKYIQRCVKGIIYYDRSFPAAPAEPLGCICAFNPAPEALVYTWGN